MFGIAPEHVIENRVLEAKAAGTLASTTTSRPRASVSANSSLRYSLPKFNVPGVEVRYDNDVVRVELPPSAPHLAAPEGIDRLSKTGLPLRLVTAAIDEGLNDKAYIVPGLGDAGDRQFGGMRRF